MSQQEFYETVQREEEWRADLEQKFPSLKSWPGKQPRSTAMKVYQVINRIQQALSKEGITKSQKNTQQGYMFRGIDAVYNTLSPLLAEHGLCILPRMLARTVIERESKNGGALFYVCVEAEFDFVCAEAGSKHVIRTFGEAMDSGDKATNKAMSAAYKYAAFQAFAIPTEGDNDADAHTHEVAPKKTIRATDGAIVDPSRISLITDVATAIKDKFEAGDVVGAYEEACGLTDVEEKTYLWGKLPSNIRSALKKQAEALKEPA